MMRASIRAMGAAALVAAASWSFPAAAQGDPASQLRQLISDIEAFVDTQSAGQASLRTGRPVETRMDGGSVVATLADLAVVGRNGNVVELGTVTVTQREVAPGRLRYELALPRRIRAVERGGNATVTVTAGDGSLVVVRDVASGLVREVELRTADLDIPPAPSGLATFIGRLELGWTISDRADGTSDAAARVALSDVRVRQARTGEAGRIGDVSIALGAQGFRAAAIERVRSAFASGGTGDARMARATDALVAAALDGGLAGITTEIAVANGVYEDGRGATPLVAVERASLRHALSGVNQSTAEYQISYTQQGLALRPDAVPLPQYIPSRANVALVFQQIPTQVLLQYLAAPGGAPLAAAAVNAINGVTVRFAPIELDTPALGATLNGSLTGDAAAPLQATGSGELVVRGLDTVLRELNAQPQGGRGAQSPAAVLAVLAALGQQGTGADGQPIRSYRIEVTQAGQLTLNGTDMTPLLGATRGQPRPARPTAPQPTQPPAAPAQPQPPPSK